MKLKLFVLILNAIYLLATIFWFVVEQSFEPIVAIIGGVVSLVSFYIANDNSFSVSVKIGRQINMGKQSIYNEFNSK
jgi:Na+-translocating ferredoxin:NAD+ oxidoreductase RnfD subunit